MATWKTRAALDAWFSQVEEILHDPTGDVPDDSGDDAPYEQGDAA
jgi:hypothetical protein